MRSVRSRLAGRFERALVVDDNDALRRSLVRLIADWGVQVVSAATLRAAAALIDPAPDLVVADIRLPDGNGRTLFEHALRMEPTPLLVAISGRATAGEGFELARLGVHTLLEKPFELSAFEQAVQSALLYSENTCDQRARLAVASRIELELRSLARRRELSVQQVQVLRLLLQGTSRKHLPAALGVSENTCKTTIRRLLARCEAARIADVLRDIVARSATDETTSTAAKQLRRQA